MPRGISKFSSGPSLPVKRKHDDLTSPIRKPQVEGPPQKKQRTEGPNTVQQQPVQKPPTDPSMHAVYDKMAHEEMLKNPKYAALADDAAKASDGKPVNVVTKDQVHGGMFYKKDNQIGLRPDLTGPKRASVMAFEATNAAQQKKFSKVTSDAFKNELNAVQGKQTFGGDLNARRENFAKSMERIEYDGIKRHHDVMKHGIDNHGWPKEMDRFGKRLEGSDPSFDSYWARQNVADAKTGKSHSDVYRAQFDNIHATAQKAVAESKAKQGIK
ncbi:hypothetical protein D7W79_02710 [Corallococcus exercitus]|uniref:Uncharacterized protein n=1 Tax=Corallococcus exercitus TaxID=2316736 RepID=A0A3A8IJ03_9BACT|nr:hypothetical protein [Corallococcus exercitus]NOK33896.1 hypothetical protein [Corallococcus exercitus]RKG82446.1 hypothetical protein D7W79_02710 [Corallococcus exercitus]